MIFRFDDFELDTELYELRRAGEKIAAEARVLDFLIYLVRHRDRVVPKEEILAAVWPGVTVGEQSISQAVYEARRLLGDDSRGQKVLQTVRRRGVRFVAAVEERARRSRAASGGAGPPGVPPFVGRVEILQELAEALDAASEGRGQVVLISGEPGIGKSRLLEEFAERIRPKGLEARFGRCREDEGAPAFWPWAQLLRAQFPHASDAERADLVAAAPHLVTLLPELAAHVDPDAPPPSTEPGAARFRLFDAVTRLYLAAAARSPCVLFIDDLHRADDLSWRMLLYLAREIRGARLLLLATYRDAPIQVDPRRRAILADLAREPVSRLEGLRGLSLGEVTSFLESYRVEEASDSIVRHLHERTGGNPFFLTHLVRLLPESTANDQSAHASTTLPTSLREAISAQIAELPASTRELLNAASVLGRDFAPRDLAHMLACDVVSAMAAIDPAAAAGVVVRDTARSDRHRFAHSLLRDALYERIGPFDRAILHGKAAEAIEQDTNESTSRLGELAHHCGEALHIVGLERAISAAERAGLSAVGSLAFGDATAHLRQAVALAETARVDNDRMFRLLLALGSAQTRAGERPAARETFRRTAQLAKSLGESERLAQVALELASGFFSILAGVFDPLVVALLRDAIRSLKPGDSLLRARLLARLAMALYWSDREEEKDQLILEAADIAGRVGDLRTQVFVGAAHCMALWSPSNLETRMDLSERVVTEAESLGEHELSLIGRVFRITCLLECGKLSRVVRHEIGEFEGILDREAVPQGVWYPLLYRAMSALERGKLGDALELAGQIIGVGRRYDDENSEQSFGVVSAVAAWHQGKGHEWIDGAAYLRDKYPAVTAWRLAVAFLNVECGRSSEALEELIALSEEDFPLLSRDMLWVFSLSVMAHLCSELVGTYKRVAVERGARIYEALSAYSGRVAVAGYGSICWGSVDRSLGKLARVLGRWDEGEGHFELGARLERREGHRVWLVETQYEHARLLLARGRSVDVPRALELSRRGLVEAEGMGLVVLATKAAAIHEGAQRLDPRVRIRS